LNKRELHRWCKDYRGFECSRSRVPVLIESNETLQYWY